MDNSPFVEVPTLGFGPTVTCVLDFGELCQGVSQSRSFLVWALNILPDVLIRRGIRQWFIQITNTLFDAVRCFKTAFDLFITGQV